MPARELMPVAAQLVHGLIVDQDLPKPNDRDRGRSVPNHSQQFDSRRCPGCPFRVQILWCDAAQHIR